MHKIWFKLCSFLLVIVMLANMLPLQSYAEQLSTGEMGQISMGTDLTEEEASAGQIVDELVNKRTEYTKQFRMDNGLFIAAVYSEPVHYEKDGQWVEIDNTLTAQLNGTYTNTAGVWNVSFPNQLTANNRISVTKDTYTLSFGMAGELRTNGDLEVMSAGETAAPAASEVLSPSDLIEGATAETFAVTQAQTSTAQLETVDIAAMKAEAEHPEMVAEKLYSGLQYNNVYGTTDIRYNLNSNTVKESIILESYSSTLRGYRYTLEVGDLNPVLQDDGSIHFYDAENKEIVMVMEAPFLVDDALEYNYDVQVRLTGSGNTYTLTYLLPTSWLASSDRAWPVVLDPTITTNLHHSNVRDVTVTEKCGSRPNDGIVECGYGKQDGIQRFFLMYDEIPTMTSSDVIVSAEVLLYKLQTSTAAATVQVHKVLGTWDASTITWSNKPDYDTSIEDFRVVRELGYYTWDVTDLVRGWYAGLNTGMMFKASAEVEGAQTNNWKQFASSNYSYYPDQMPTVTIEFKNNNGLESYWDYTSSSAGRAGAGHVNNFTGNLVWTRSDIGFGGNRMPVSISHVYNLNDAGNNEFGLGYGWRTNFNQTIEGLYIDDDKYYIWEDSDGTSHYFENTAYGEFKDEDKLGLTLISINVATTFGVSGAKYSITDKNGNVSLFDTQGRLIRQINNQATKSYITVSYTDTTGYRIDKITDGVGRVYDFTYAQDSNLLESIQYLGSDNTVHDAVEFDYSTSGDLEEITDTDGEYCTYTYNSDHILLTAQDIDGYKLQYTYYEPVVPTDTSTTKWQPYRVKQIAAFDDTTAGGTLKFEYSHNQTVLEDHNGNKQIMQFDNRGNTTCIQDGEGRAQYAEFVKDDSGETAKGNQLALASKLQYTVASIAKDSSFENDTLWSLEPSDAAASRSISSTTYYGSKSMCLTATDAADLLGTTFAVSAGESYTFSAYVKVSSGSARLALRNTADASDTEYSEALTSDTWTRLEVCYTNDGTGNVTLAPTLSAAAGTTVYMDCVQVEKAPTASRYNLIENGDFRYSLDTWTKTGCTTVDTVALQTKTVDGVEREDPAAPQLDAYAFEITGSPTSEKRLTQTVNISGAADDSFVFAGWAKGNAATIKEKAGDNEEVTREFGIQLVFNYTDGNSSDPFTVHFNTDSNEWQYVAAAAVAEQAYASVTIRLVYDYNMNTAYFDGIQLFKEQFGTSYTYDDEGNVKTVVDVQKQKTTYEYDTNNNLTKILQDNKAKMTYEYYPNSHNVKKATSEEGLVYNFVYDTYGNNISVSIGSGETKITSSATYSSNGNLLETTTDALGKVTTYDYDANTNVLKSVKYPEDTEATKTTYSYDSMYRMASAAVTTDTGLNLSASYTYNNDLLTKIQTASTTYDFTYGNFGLRTSVDIGERNLATYHYNDETLNGGQDDYRNDLDRLAYGNGDMLLYEYDDQGRVTKQTYEDGDTVSYQYDNSGALATVTDSATGRKTTYYYDLTDRMVKYVESGTNYNHSVGYEYNADNNLTSLVETINGTDYTTSYTYDDDNRVTEITKNNVTTTYAYDNYGRSYQQVTTKNNLEGTTNTFTFRNPTDTTTSTQISTQLIEAYEFYRLYTYTYDDNGNILTVTHGNKTTSYVYDSANQLIRENNQELGYTYVWEYDNAGNIQTEKVYAYTTDNITADTETISINSYTYGNTKWGDLLTAYNGTEISYDEIGNPERNGEWEYTWEHGRQLASMSDGTETWTYTYNADGLRTKRTNGTHTYEYVYTGNQLAQMKVDNFYTFNFTYDANGFPQTISLGDYTYYYVTNIQGDVVGILNEEGILVVLYGYTAWGTVEILYDHDPISGHNPLLYRGYVYDQETELYYLQSRYYDPNVGRFLNADGQLNQQEGVIGFNVFSYCINSPVNGSDPCGTCFHHWKFWKDCAKCAAAKEEKKAQETAQTIKYNVPLYKQGSLSLCWAFCQTMMESYNSGTMLTQKEAKARAIAIAQNYHGSTKKKDWNQGGWPSNLGTHVGNIGSIEELYTTLQDNGPVYAYYSDENSAHIVIVTGVNLYSGVVYTNNPWGVSGVQSFEKFQNGYATKWYHFASGTSSSGAIIYLMD